MMQYNGISQHKQILRSSACLINAMDRFVISVMLVLNDVEVTLFVCSYICIAKYLKEKKRIMFLI